MVVAPSTLNCWVSKYAPQIEHQFRARNRPVGKSWRLAEPDVRMRGAGPFIACSGGEWPARGFVAAPQRDRGAAEAFLRKAIPHSGPPEKITLDQSGSHTAALTRSRTTHKRAIVLR